MKKNELHDLIDTGVLQARPDADLWRAEVDELVKEGFLQMLPNHYFAFKSNLTWEVVYETLLYAERRHLHGIVAKHIENFSTDKIEAVADLLQHHFEEAGNIPKCIYYCSISGDRAANMYANEDAIFTYQKALNILQNEKDNDVFDRVLLDEKLGDVNETSGKYTNAIEHYTRSLKLSKSIKKTSKTKPEIKYVPWPLNLRTIESELCRKIAVACEHNSEYDESLQWLDKSLEALPNRPGKIACQIYASRSATQFRKGLYEDAILSGKKALSHAKKLQLLSETAYANNMISNSYIEMGMLHKATKHLKQAVSTYNDLQDMPGIAASNSNLGAIYMLIGELDSATHHYDIALKADERMQNESNIAIDHNNLGEVLFAKGNIKKAIAHHEKVLEAHSRNVVHSGLAGYTLMNMCRCQIEMGDLTKADKHLDESLTFLENSGVQGVHVEAELQKAELRYIQGKYQQAHDLCETVLIKINDLNAKLLEARGHRILGNISSAMGNLDTSIKLMDSSIKLAQQIGAEHEQAKSLISLVRISSANNLDSTLINQRKLTKSIKLLTQIGAKNEIIEAEQLLSELR